MTAWMAWRPLLRGLGGRVLAGVLMSACATAQTEARTSASATLTDAAHPASPAELDLHLEVIVNGVSTGLIAHVRQTPAGHLLMEPGPLRATGLLSAASALHEDGWVDLGLLPGVHVRYQQATQTLDVAARDAALAVRVFDLQGPERPAASELPPRDWGAFINHTLYLGSGGGGWSGLGRYQNASALLEANLYGPVGTLSSTHVLSAQRAAPQEGRRRVRSVRLDTQWAWFDENRLMSVTAGDFVGSSLPWNRAVRLGGVQIRRNFAIRPDLVTMPVLSELSGSAAVPSTVELYVNNARRFSQEIAPGPFAITNLPLITGAGSAQLVIRDALGRESVSETPFYASSALLAPGLSDFALEAGFARRNYGASSNDYDQRPLASANVRYGLSNAATLEGYAQAGGRLALAGAGGVFRLGAFGAAGLAGAFSRYGAGDGDGNRHETGAQLAAHLELEAGGVRFYARHQRTVDEFNDLASITLGQGASALTRQSARPLRRMSQTSLSFPYRATPGLNLSYTPITRADGSRSRLLGVNLGQRLPGNGWLSVSAHRDLQRRDSAAIFVTLSWFPGNRLNASSGQSWDRHRLASTTAELSRSGSNHYGSVGWRVRAVHGHGPGGPRAQSANASIRCRIGRIEAGVEHVQRSGANAAVNGRVQFDGALVLADGGVFFANRIADAFAVVNVGAADVEVRHENTPIGKTNARGQVLLSGLRAYERNLVSIDPMTLPVDARIPVLRQVASPRWKSGVRVDFDVVPHTRTALLTVHDETGELLAVGTQAQLNDGAVVVVGYEGQVWLEGIAQMNRLRVKRPGKPDCVATFTAPATMRERLLIPDAVCRSGQ